jgi:hypothetical protein
MRHHPEDLAFFPIMMELMPVVDFESAVSCKVDAKRSESGNTAGVPYAASEIPSCARFLILLEGISHITRHGN